MLHLYLFVGGPAEVFRLLKGRGNTLFGSSEEMEKRRRAVLHLGVTEPGSKHGLLKKKHTNKHAVVRFLDCVIVRGEKGLDVLF